MVVQIKKGKTKYQEIEISSLLALIIKIPNLSHDLKTPSRRLFNPGLISQILGIKLRDVQSVYGSKCRSASVPLYRDPIIINAIGKAIQTIEIQ